MCASYEARFSITELVRLLKDAEAPLDLPGGLPNLEPRDEVRPTNLAPVIVATGGDGAATTRLADQRFGFPPPAGRKGGPVINYRSEGRTLGNGARGGRCLVPASGFYEFTGDRYPKTRWRLSATDSQPLMLAAVWRAGAEDQHAVSTLAAEHFLPAESRDVDLVPWQVVSEHGAGRVGEGQAFADVGDPVAVRNAHAAGGAVPGEQHVVRPVDGAQVGELAVVGADDGRVELQLL
ncbi:MAG: SOS response-associated peptidase family protein, partial [Alphaproteobacteria bacterium]|nr:SOS response-associated peptidase family protein [Alphaproteobacteria bacterium]